MHTNFLLFLFLYKSNEQNIHYADHTLLTTFSRSKTLKFSSPESFRIELIYADHAVFPNVVPYSIHETFMLRDIMQTMYEIDRLGK
jgi:hypothetical protein